MYEKRLTLKIILDILCMKKNKLRIVKNSNDFIKYTSRPT